jgi:hypothetical protein
MIRHLPIKRTLKTRWWCSRGGWRSGESGRYFMVLKWPSENGLSSETRGREWLLVAPRSASKKATGFEIMGEPRSACRVS